jgi:hypothetical protein
MAAIEITGAHPPRVRLKPGDVVMVRRKMRDRHSDKPFVWKFLATVYKSNSPYRLRLIRFGADEGKDVMDVHLSDDRNTVHVLTEDSWPDGVHAFRTRLILEGRLDDAVLG